MKFLKSHSGFSQIIIIAIILVAILIGVYLVQTKTNLFPFATILQQITPQTSFILESDPKSPAMGDEFKVNLFVRSDLDATNLYVAKLKFEPEFLKVITIKTEERDGIESAVKLWAERKWDNNSGTISLVGGIPSPGLKTNVDSKPALMAVIIFKATKEGVATIAFEDSSAIYRNSDNVNIISAKNSMDLDISSSKNLVSSPSPSISASSSPQISPSPVPVANLSLIPNLKRSCSYDLDIVVDTSSYKTLGTDAVIKYDPAIFTINSITNGTFYLNYPGNLIRPTYGIVSVTGLSSVSNPIGGKGVLATLNVTINPNAALGQTVINFDFDPNNPGKTSDSNIVILENGISKEILGAVFSGIYNISTGNCP